MDFLEELKTLATELDRNGIDYALCGGLAVAVYARPRATLDIDVMIESGSLSKTVDVVRKIGFDLRSAPMKFKNGAVIIHRFTKIDDSSGEHLPLDLLLVTPETEKAWDDRITVEWEGRRLKVVSPEGLILLKLLRGSGQDQDDIQYLRSLKDEN